ncbi:tetratricopeptide repeat protein [Micromonospora sp. WMMD812]|uniref:tetratricopeptide repeat protein n=1 Tax=Micromonospora sp. WMMD812 TaxID=3015152 RepID=UPI00248CDCAB|nr:tetratricopeptide repeat protein [Micromonospora sp. WMMD812]WBB64861.1 tetratricopeptide repeat protein [Micromonospora sp. WMMD812]
MSGADVALARAAHLLEVNRAEAALDELARLPADVALGVTAFRLRAAALTGLDRWDEVATAARQGLAEAGPDAELSARLALALRRHGEYAPAERVLIEALAVEPTNPGLLCQYADLCTAVGQTDKAARLVARAAALAPRSPAVFASRFQVAYVQGRHRAAERIARDFLGAWPDDPAALAMHGLAAAQRGRMGAAYRSFGQAVSHSPDDVGAADAAWEARLHVHPLLLPLRPLRRWGMLRTWLVAVAMMALPALAGLDLLAGLLGLLWITYCAYALIAPALVRRLVQGRWRP